MTNAVEYYAAVVANGIIAIKLSVYINHSQGEGQWCFPIVRDSKDNSSMQFKEKKMKGPLGNVTLLQQQQQPTQKTCKRQSKTHDVGKGNVNDDSPASRT